MIIGIDGNEANEVRPDLSARAGVNYYAFEILNNLYKLNQKQQIKNKFIIYLKNLPGNDLPKQNNWWEYRILKGKEKWIIKKLTPHLIFTKSKPDVFFSPSHYLPYVPRLSMVCTIHDLGYLNSSGQFKKTDFWQLKYWSAMSISISKYIISVSENTRKDIVRHYKSAINKSFVVHHGYDTKRFNTKINISDVRRVKKKFGLNKVYILFLSTLKPSKNIIRLLEAYSDISDPIKLVIAGGKGWYFDEIYKKVEELNIKDKVIFTGYLDEIDKPALMKGAKLFVSPSLWEGFGMHVLEAMACGTPVVVSNIASLPEVAGGAGVYVDPNSVESIKMGITEVLDLNEKRYNMLVNKVLTQAEKFSWEKSAKETLNILEKAGK